ncbi:hypothetical protein PU783_000275 [Cronobacter sakazakii]|nr:hypothetical protein [Cronobacter sakazakii]EKM6438146.1 hypothetical protein [Cronobacter sakazakii]
MKLIDLLLQELPKRGGWPDRASYAAQDWNGGAFFYSVKPYLTASGRVWDSSEVYEEFFMLDGASDYATAIITREQYEAALAAAQQPVWNGEGLPPVGCRIEAFSGGEWVEAIVTYNEPPEFHGDAAAWKEVLAFDCRTTRPFWTDEFRPIRSEADKKRDSIIAEIGKAYKNCPHSEAVPYAIYEAIAKHIRIE